MFAATAAHVGPRFRRPTLWLAAQSERKSTGLLGNPAYDPIRNALPWRGGMAEKGTRRRVATGSPCNSSGGPSSTRTMGSLVRKACCKMEAPKADVLADGPPQEFAANMKKNNKGGRTGGEAISRAATDKFPVGRHWGLLPAGSALSKVCCHCWKNGIADWALT